MYQSTDLMRKISVEIRAFVHSPDYQKDQDNQDFIATSIVAINSLLDSDVHPDNIYICCCENNAKEISIIVNKYHKNGIALNIIAWSLGGEITEHFPLDHRKILLNCPHEITSNDNKINSFLNYIRDKLKIPNVKSSFPKLISGDANLALISIFLQINQMILQENLTLKNPDFPNERVEVEILEFN